MFSSLGAASAHADMCGGGGHDSEDAPVPDAAARPDAGPSDAGSGAAAGRRARHVGGALILVAGLGGTWLVFRRRGNG